MEKVNVAALVALGLVLVTGIGGTLGALALGNEDIASALLGGTVGLLGGLLAPQMALRAPAKGSEP